MASRAVTQLYDDALRPSGLRVTQFSLLAALARLGETNLGQLTRALAIDQTTLTRSLALLETSGVIERAPHPDGRIKSVRLSARGRRALDLARPLWAQAQGRVLRELGTAAWVDVQRRLAHLLRVAVTKRPRGRGRPARSAGQPGTGPADVALPLHSRRLVTSRAATSGSVPRPRHRGRQSHGAVPPPSAAGIDAGGDLSAWHVPCCEKRS